MKKLLCILVSVMLLVVAVGCANTATNTTSEPEAATNTPDAAVVETAEPQENGVEPEQAAASYVPGTYKGTGSGMFGDVVLAVTFSADSITEINVLEKHETEKVTTPAFTIMPQRIIEAQSLMVDVVSSATYASRAILAAVEDAATQASDDISALQAPIEKTPGQDIELSTDVLVIGAGGAGMSASASAAEQGAKVIVVEKNEWAGGNTVVSGGAWNAADPELAAATPTKSGQLNTLEGYLALDPEEYGPAADTLRTLQEQITQYLAGDTSMMFDSTEMFAFQTYIGGIRTDLNGDVITGDFDLVQTFADNSLSTRKWVESLGGAFGSSLVEASGALWTRALAPDASASTTEQIATYVTNLENVVLDAGGRLLYDTTATELIYEDGAVKGAICEMADGTKVTIRAKSTVMACGGYGSNLKMIQEYDTYWGNLGDNIGHTTLPTTVGDGAVMGEKIGAQLVGMNVVQLNKGFRTTGLHAAQSGVDVIFVNSQGKRFVNEYAARDVYTKAAIEQGGEYYCIMSAENVMDKKGVFDTFYFDTIEEMAAKFDMDAAVLTEEIEKYNSYVDAGEDPEFGKNVFGDKIEAPYAIMAWVPIIHHTMGGLKIDTEAQVLDTNDKPIQGLYAAGEVTGGIHGGNRLGGNAVADAFTFGRIAGINAAK